MEEGVDSDLRHMATKSEVAQEVGDFKSEMKDMEVRLMRRIAMIVVAGVGITAAITTLA